MYIAVTKHILLVQIVLYEYEMHSTNMHKHTYAYTYYTLRVSKLHFVLVVYTLQTST